MISDRLLEKQIAKAQDDADLAKRGADEAKAEAERAMTEAGSAMGEAKEALRNAEKIRTEAEERMRINTLNIRLIDAGYPTSHENKWKEALNLGQDAVKNGKATPEIRINVARVIRHHVSTNEAIDALNSAITYFTQNKVENFYISNAYFNRACYFTELYLKTSSSTARETAIADVELCLQFAENPKSEIEDMQHDPDLAELVGWDEFGAIVNRYTRT